MNEFNYENTARFVFLIGEVTTESIMKIIAKIQILDSINHDPIILEINSSGGSVDDGLALIDVMNSVKSPIYTVALGQASSMASLILSSGEKGYRKANKHCKILLHQLQAGYSGKFDDITELYNATLKTNEIIYKLYSKNTGMPVNKIKSKIQTDCVLDGIGAKNMGLIDSIIE